MLDKIRRNAFLMAAGFLMWQGWSGAQAQGESEDAKPPLPLPKLEASFLRGPDSPPQDFGEGKENGVRDPFHLLRSSLKAQEEAMADLGVPAQAPGLVEEGGEAVQARPPSVLQLQSTLKPPHGEPTAIINGHILRVGEALEGFDEDHPPVLVEIQGTKAVLRYQDQLITLDVAGTASVAVAH